MCNCYMFSVVNVYLDHLKFCVVCINGRIYVCCSECNVVSDKCRVCVSSCIWCVFVVHPVAIMSAVFCVICSLVMFVSNASGDHMVDTYSSMGLVMALYVVMIAFF